MTDRITSMPEQIACVQLPEREFGLVHDEMNQTLGGVLLSGPPIIPVLLPFIILDYVSEWWDSEE